MFGFRKGDARWTVTLFQQQMITFWESTVNMGISPIPQDDRSISPIQIHSHMKTLNGRHPKNGNVSWTQSTRVPYIFKRTQTAPKFDSRASVRVNAIGLEQFLSLHEPLLFGPTCTKWYRDKWWIKPKKKVMIGDVVIKNGIWIGYAWHFIAIFMGNTWDFLVTDS